MIVKVVGFQDYFKRDMCLYVYQDMDTKELTTKIIERKYIGSFSVEHDSGINDRIKSIEENLLRYIHESGKEEDHASRTNNNEKGMEQIELEETRDTELIDRSLLEDDLWDGGCCFPSSPDYNF